MRNAAAIVAGVVAAGVGGVLFVRSRVGVRAMVATGKHLPNGRVRNVDRAAGVDGRLLAFLQWWDKNGPFVITVGNDNAGLRTDEAWQAAAYARGVSGAKTLSETAHGRGGALDVYGYEPGDGWKLALNDRAKFTAIGEAAEKHGLKWGGRFSKFDGPHIEVPDWRALPMPGARVA